MIAAIGAEFGVEFDGLEHLPAANRRNEIARQNTEYGLRATIDHQGAADHVFVIPVMALPEPMANDDAGCARNLVLFHEQTTSPRLDVEDFEEAGGHGCTRHPLGFAASGVIERRRCVSARGSERTTLVAP